MPPIWPALLNATVVSRTVSRAGLSGRPRLRMPPESDPPMLALLESIRLDCTVIAAPMLPRPAPEQARPFVERMWSSSSVPSLRRLPPQQPLPLSAVPSRIVRCEIVAVTPSPTSNTR
jgi:hypothetical protein